MSSILIVDDSSFMRASLRLVLEEAGYKTNEVGSANEAILRYREIKPDLVTMDITMPGLDGIEGVKEIIKIDPQAKIIMVSALGQKAKVIEAISHGAKDYIVKPLENKRVLEAVQRLIS